MTKTARYVLLALGFIIFLVLAPLTVLYVRGLSFNFKTRSFVQTGILAIKTDPSDVQVFLNNKLARKGSGDVKFLLPDEYQVAFKKTGYFDWNKRLEILPGQVTWANQFYNTIYLLENNQPAKTIANNVLNFYYQGNQIVYLTPSTTNVSSIKNLSQTQSFLLPKPVNNILTADYNNKNFVFVNSGASTTNPTILVFNSDSGVFRDISQLFNEIPKMQFSQNDQLYALDGLNLYLINPALGTKTLFLKNVRAFNFQGNDLYFIQKQSQGSSLFISQQPYTQEQIILNTLPAFTIADLKVTYQKQIFLLADHNLYLANASMELLADNVDLWDFESADSAVAVLHSSEFGYYDTSAFGGSLNLITRSDEPLSAISVKPEIGYAFFNRDNSVNAIELDTRNNQNQYTLYSGTNIQKFIVDDQARNIVLLDNGELKSLKIR